MAQDPLEVFEKKRTVKDARLFWSMNQASIHFRQWLRRGLPAGRHQSFGNGRRGSICR